MFLSLIRIIICCKLQQTWWECVKHVEVSAHCAICDTLTLGCLSYHCTLHRAGIGSWIECQCLQTSDLTISLRYHSHGCKQWPVLYLNWNPVFWREIYLPAPWSCVWGGGCPTHLIMLSMNVQGITKSLAIISAMQRHSWGFCLCCSSGPWTSWLGVCPCVVILFVPHWVGCRL